jgi:phosphatidylglycerol lysyltransferase
MHRVAAKTVALERQIRRKARVLRKIAWDSGIVSAIAVLVAGSGILNLWSLMGGPEPSLQRLWIKELFALDFVGLSRTLTLFSGFALLLTALHLGVRKRRAWQVTLILSAASAVFHLTKGWDVPEALCSFTMCVVLWASRERFPIGAGRVPIVTAAARAAISFSIAGIYGAAGFWLLSPGEFHHNFHWWDAALQTFRLMLFMDSTWPPRTAYAAWFADSLLWMSAAAFVYSGIVLFRPVVYRFRVDWGEAEAAQAIAQQHGRTGQDFFKHWPDKSYFFSKSRQSFLGYRVAGNFALVLGDPVGPESDRRDTIAQFAAFCQSRGWHAGFHQVSAESLATYRELGFRSLKVGDDAIVDLSKFSLAGSAMKEFRNTVNRLERLGYRVERVDPPLAEPLLSELQSISDRWLGIPGHRERQFTLGRFERGYVQATPVYVVWNADDQAVAFLNLVPSYDPDLATVDLMRRKDDSVNGVMDFLFAKVFLDLKTRGVRFFNLGMAPLSADRNQPSPWDERAVRWLIGHAPFIFRADSLRRFKSKYADAWEPRYAVFRSRWDLPRLALALKRVSELPRAA